MSEERAYLPNNPGFLRAYGFYLVLGGVSLSMMLFSLLLWLLI